MPVQVQSHEIELCLQNSTERVQIAIYDEKGRPIDPIGLKLNVLDLGNTVLSSDILYPLDGEIQSPVLPRIKRSGKGVFYFPFGADNANGYPATFYGANPPAPNWDISVNNQLKLAVDSRPFITVTLTAANPAQATPAEIVTSINQALFSSPSYGTVYGRVARFYGDRLFLTSPKLVDSCNSRIQIDTTIPNNATPQIFGPGPSPVNVSGVVSNGDQFVTALLSNRTLDSGDKLFHWQVTAARGLGSASIIQVVKVASPRAFSILPYFRLELDKALKQVGRDLARTGYTNAQLMGYLTLAVTEINAFQPITNLTLESFPSGEFMMILLWTALIIALISQGLFAIDTDIDYSDRGASFRLDHAGKLSGYLNTIIARLESRMAMFKLQYADVGTVKIELGPSFRLATVLNAAPTGSLFRNLWSGGTM